MQTTTAPRYQLCQHPPSSTQDLNLSKQMDNTQHKNSPNKPTTAVKSSQQFGQTRVSKKVTTTNLKNSSSCSISGSLSDVEIPLILKVNTNELQKDATGLSTLCRFLSSKEVSILVVVSIRLLLILIAM